ncbi:unnamed protein product [Sphenostylis stenocarpa]|uniref:Uncharacterized protein n=1 Tax=Sphenostylis stenocarpa TaxID=92480 RepID=A0AA86VGU7_9FABA|nr:unnamed protein product [Sphenostylis stenocarpa]
MADQKCPHSMAAYIVSDSQPLRRAKRDIQGLYKSKTTLINKENIKDSKLVYRIHGKESMVVLASGIFDASFTHSFKRHMLCGRTKRKWEFSALENYGSKGSQLNKATIMYGTKMGKTYCRAYTLQHFPSQYPTMNCSLIGEGGLCISQ